MDIGASEELGLNGSMFALLMDTCTQLHVHLARNKNMDIFKFAWHNSYKSFWKLRQFTEVLCSFKGKVLILLLQSLYISFI